MALKAKKKLEEKKPAVEKAPTTEKPLAKKKPTVGKKFPKESSATFEETHSTVSLCG
ncbi:UNVERIFIED_CONTAM: hypothetical protein Sradi_1328600 [Sesamum radiatum]|uniref:Uncharacterized protein n=1 Tax=Sesamum radiatum TaxID=300843 RepID=A0AAW2UPJ5_SESRA